MGGLSPQECVVPIISVTAREDAVQPTIQSVGWRSLRCSVTVPGATRGMRVDIRTRADDASSSLTEGEKELADDGSASLLVVDYGQQGNAAIIVILDAEGRDSCRGQHHHRGAGPAMMALDRVDELAAEAFPGYVVRKDLARQFKGRYPVPEYVSEFLIGRYCASTDEREIEEGLAIVEIQMRNRTVRPGDEELFKSRAP